MSTYESLTSVQLVFFLLCWIVTFVWHGNGLSPSKLSVSSPAITSMVGSRHIVRIAEPVWRQAVEQHVDKIRACLEPGLTSKDHVMNTGRRRSSLQQTSSTPAHEWCTALDPKNPVYNFLIEYYGLKGAKGPKRLARWSPNPALIFSNQERITSFDDFMMYSHPEPITTLDSHDERRTGGVLLEGATENDVGGVLHLRGALPYEDGIVFSPASFFASSDDPASAATPYLWYQSVLTQTLSSEPIFHCFGLHEWAMQYQPDGADPPPSAKYQSHLPLRVSRDVINQAVERRGISCTHVDALRYFAPAAGPLNHHGATLQRTDQLRLEQKACVHAHMDLLKIALRLQPFVDPFLLQRVLKIALESRRLDVAASPYDAKAYSVGVVAVETEVGRREYRKQQMALMDRADLVRKELLDAYDLFLKMAFDESITSSAQMRAAPERFAKAEPGGPSWRRNLVDSTQ